MTQEDQLAITEPAKGNMGVCLSGDSVTLVGVVVVAAVAIVALVLSAVSLSQGPAQVTINGEMASTAGGYDNNRASHSMAYTNPNNKIWTFAIGHDASPYEYQNSQGYTAGFNVELISAVCQEARVTCHLVYDDYNNCWNGSPGKHPIPGQGLLGGWYDGCVGWSQQASRMNSVKFSDAWTMPDSTRFILRSGENTLSASTMYDLNGLKIGFLDGWVSDEHCIARQENIIGNDLASNQIFHYKTQADAFQALKNRTIDAVFHNANAALDDGLAYAEILPYDLEPCMQDGLSMMLKKDSNLPSWFNTALASVRDKGVYDKLCRDAPLKHAGNEIKRISCYRN